MAFDIKAWTFSKRKNSTLQPPAADAVEISVVLKEETSYNNPVFLLRYDGDFPFNYFAWGSWYYFLVDVRSVRNNLFEVECVLDPLATYKAEILASSAFVLYSGNLGNSNIVDPRLSIRAEPTISANTFSLDFISEAPDTAVVSVVGMKGCASYALSISDAARLMRSISIWSEDNIPVPDEITGDTLEEVVDSIMSIGTTITTGLRQLVGTGSAPNAIRSAMVVPFTSGSISGTSETIYLGMYDSGITGKRITGRIKSDIYNVNIPWQSSGWEKNEPYHHVYLYLPYVGLIHLPASDLLSTSTLLISVIYDTAAATMDYIVTTSAGLRIGHYSANVGAPLAIGASNFTPLQAASVIGAGAAGAAGVMAAGGPLGAVAAGAASIIGILNNAAPLPSAIGSNGGLSGVEFQGACITAYRAASAAVAPVIGAPTMAAVQLGTVSGYCQTRAASVAVSAPDGIRQEINSLLDSGIFIE